MRYLQTALTGAALLACVNLEYAGSVRADKPAATLEQQATALAKNLAAACPVARYDDEVAFEACSSTLQRMTLPLEAEIAWGGDQPDKPIRKKGLTHFNSQVFQSMYLPLYSFTGRWRVDEDTRSHAPVIRLEAYFRNRLPSGDYPYPFWHSADKWNAYETSNQINLYLSAKGLAFIVTRDAAGSEDDRGTYAHAATPAFNGAWQWRDAAGGLQPHTSLFSARYGETNPYLPELDEAYRSFALRMRDESCLDCHTPANKAEADRLVLLQTPRHAAGEIDNVIKAIRSNEMPQDDIGLRKEIPAEHRAAMLAAAVAFRNQLKRADEWEVLHPR